jgi:hypothetical protein
MDRWIDGLRPTLMHAYLFVSKLFEYEMCHNLLLAVFNVIVIINIIIIITIPYIF